MQKIKKQKNKQFKLSPSGRLLVAVNLALLSPLAMAGGIDALGSTTVKQKDGVDIINIAKPNQNGLSHNQYNNFNVSTSGAVLNNSLTKGKSQLAGELSKNTNFKDQAAKVILNEVVSKNPSLIMGSQEVFGMAADYVLANPNGISYEAGKIINAPRASFVVGSPEVKGDTLLRFDTSASNADLTVTGGDFSDVSALDLLAPSVEVKSNISTKSAINVTSGHNKINYADTTVEAVNSGNRDVVLDGRIFGAMNSGSIRVHSTDTGQIINGADLTASKELLIDSKGELSVTSSNLSSNDMQLSAQKIKLDGTVKKTDSSDESSEKSRKRVLTETKSNSSNETFSGSSISANNLQLKSKDDISFSGVTVDVKNNLDVDTNDINFSAVTTKETNQYYEKKSKGSWFNKTESSQVKETVHVNTINVQGDANINASGSFNAEALNLSVAGKKAEIKAAKGINMSGAVATNEYHYNNEVKNETAKLKTGHLRKDNTSQDFYKSSITTDNLLLTTDGDIALQGTTVEVNTLLTEADKVQLDAQLTKATDSNDKKFRFIGGADEHNTADDKEFAHTTDIIVNNEALVKANNGIALQGSNIVTDGKGYLVAGNGNLVADGKVISHSESESKREGGVFNITKSEVANSQTNEGVVASKLKSHTNLELVSKGDVNVSGSTIEVAEELNIQAGKNFKLGTTTTNSSSESHKSGVSADADYSYDISGLTTGAEANVSVTTENTKTEKTENVGSKVNAGNINVNAKQDATVEGSIINAEGDVNVNAENIAVISAKDTKKEHSKVTTTTVGVGIEVAFNEGQPGVTGTTGVSADHKDTNTVATTSQASSINGNNINLTTKKPNSGAVTIQGSAINAAGSLVQKAKEINQIADANTVDTTEINVNGKFEITAGTDISKVINGSTNLDVSGGKKVTQTSEAVVSTITAENVSNTAEKVKDTGTQYEVTNKLEINSGDYTNEVATNTSSEISHNGGGKIGVSASSSDLQTVDVGIDVEGEYSHTNSNSSTAIKGNIGAGSLNINANDSAIAADINVSGDANISATNGVTLTQSHNMSETTEAGANVNVGVGALIIPAATAAIPEFEVGAGTNYQKETSSEGVSADVNAGHLTINSNKKVAIDGSNINADKIDIQANEVSSNGLTNTNSKKGGSGSANVGVGANLSGDTSFGIDFSGNKEEETTHTANNINGNVNISVQNGLTLTGTKVKGDDVTLTNTNGSVVLDSLTGSKKKTSVGAGVNVEGSIEEGAFTAGSGDAHLDIDIARNKTHTGSAVTGNDVTINSNGNLEVADTVVTADNLFGTVNGDVNVVSNQDVTNEFGLNIAVAAGGEVADIAKPQEEEEEAEETTQSVETEETTDDVAENSEESESEEGVAEEEQEEPNKWESVATVINQGSKIQGQVSEIIDIVKENDGKVTNDITSEVIDGALDNALDLAGQLSDSEVIPALQADVNDGTIMGISAAAAAGLHIDNSKKTQDAGIEAGNIDLAIAGEINNNAGHINSKQGLENTTINSSSNTDHSVKVDVGFDISTDLSEMAEQAIKHIQTGKSSLGYADVEIERKHKVGGTVNK